jgi:uncharacterized protein
MRFQSLLRLVYSWLVIAAFLSAGPAMAQSEPTLKQIYIAADSGKLDQAQSMIQQVLVAHPASAKAHFVQSELFLRQGKLDSAREALATADKLAPGLPFANSEAIQGLRARLASRSLPAGKVESASTPPNGIPVTSPSSTSASSWELPVLLVVGVIGLGYMAFRRKPPSIVSAPAPAQYPGGLGGAQTFGNAVNTPAAQGTPMQSPYAQSGATGGSGLGGRVMGGLATGLAVGAGVMAAEAIGKTLTGNHNPAGAPAEHLRGSDPLPGSIGADDMGGQNFGVEDNGSWDDGGSADMGGGGGGDWDS